MSSNFGCCRVISSLTLQIITASLLAFPLVLLAGCSRSTTVDAVPQPSNDSDPIAIVNGVVINRDEMYSEMEQYVPSQLQGFPQNPLLAYSAGRVALQHLITNELLVQLASLDNVPVTDAEVAARYDDVKMVKETQATSSFEDLLANQGLTTQQFEYSTIAPDVAQFNLVSKGLEATDQELHAYYTAHIADYTEPDRIHIERIVVLDQATAQAAYTSSSPANSLDTVMSENIAEPFTGGENAADFAQWINTDAPPALLKPIILSAASAQPGTVLKPIRIANQWWLVKLVDRRNKIILPFDTVKHMVQWNVETTKANQSGNFQRMQSQIQDLTQQAVINVTQPQYISLVKQLKNPPPTSPLTTTTEPAP